MSREQYEKKDKQPASQNFTELHAGRRVLLSSSLCQQLSAAPAARYALCWLLVAWALQPAASLMHSV